MSQVFSSTQWDQFLPHSFHWVADVRRDNVSAEVPKAWHIVGVTREEKGPIHFDAPELPQAVLAKIQDQCQILGWKGQTPFLKLVVGDTPWLLVVEQSSTISPPQRGRQLGLDAAQALQELPSGVELVIVSGANFGVLDVWEGLALGWYNTPLFMVPAAPLELPKALKFLGIDVTNAEAKTRVLRIQAALLTKALQDAPANWLDPQRFTDIAQAAVPARNGVSWEVVPREKMVELGMGSFLAVAQGSSKEAMILIARIPGRDRSRTIALVGKGVTFDSGGINLKPSAGMEEMKYDMSGAAGVLGAAYYLARQEPPFNVVCAMAMVENLPSGVATRPGDVVKSYSGKTIEVINTDAEGRLVLCDTLSYVIVKDRPQQIYCIATLTGAVIQALGHAGAAFMSDDQAFAARIKVLAEKAGEPLWQLPLWPELKKELKSKIADLANIPKSNVLAGSVMGGLFLAEFMKEKGLAWAHIDIAGTAWSCAATGYPSSGGSSFGVRILIDACLGDT